MRVYILHHTITYSLRHYVCCCRGVKRSTVGRKTDELALSAGKQVLLPLLQGTFWTLALQGWRFWNRTAKFSGANVGSRIRRWWWGVNNWEIPAERDARTAAVGMSESERFAGEIGEVSFSLFRLIVGA